jgi:hypothetical protein
LKRLDLGESALARAGGVALALVGGVKAARAAAKVEHLQEDVMKRTLILGIGALLVIASMASPAEAQSPTPQNPAGTAIGANFVDLNGDGICDNFQSGARMGNGQGNGKGQGQGKGRRLGDGTHPAPKDGTGFGAPAGAGAGGGTGQCDGTGPKGRGARTGRR